MLLRLVCPSLLLVCTGLLACANWQAPWSKAPAIVAQAWQRQTLLVEPGAGNLGTPSVFVDAAGQPAVALADRAFYMGAQSVVLARRGDAGWRVEFPLERAPWRVCARAGEGSAVVLAVGGLEGPLAAVGWDGVQTTPAEPGPCPRPSSNVREATNAAGAHQLERSRDGKTLWHAAPTNPCPALDAAPGQAIGAFGLAIDHAGRVAVAYLERPEGDQAAPGRLLHATCNVAASGAPDDGHGGPPNEPWTSSVVAEGVRVTEVGLALDGAGRSHVAYVVAEDGRERLVHAAPIEGEPAKEIEADARVAPAIEACLRVRQSPLRSADVAAYQAGDGLRCAVLERDPGTSQQALAILDPRCEAGDAPACALAGALHHFVMGEVTISLELPAADGTTRFETLWQGLRPKGIAEDIAEAARRYERACDLGDAKACLHHAVLLASGDPRRLARATTACEAGHAHGCALALAAVHLRPDAALRARVEPVLRAACEAGDMVVCSDLGVALHVGGDAGGARAAFERACAGELQSACRHVDSP